MSEPADPTETLPDDSPDESLLCPHCIEPIGTFDHFCPHCGKPITAHASTDPFGQIFSTGRLYYNAVHTHRPRRVIVIGIWLIFGPSILTLTAAIMLLIHQWLWPPQYMFDPSHVFVEHVGGQPGPETPLWLALILCAALWSVNAAILYRVTARYMCRRRHRRLTAPTGIR